MSALAIWVTFKVAPERFDRFHAAALEDARCSVRDEPGCRRFDVLIPKDREGSLTFYEVYDDADALAAHRQTPHYAAFAAAAEEAGVERTITPFILSNATEA
ncbi:MAG: antibiotic biosynthesis monooxygenase [Proteobacteria bacterium]|nr:antibiotic biosynthesis monooxygenase [Pseudomonadota bacterium]